MRGLLKRAAAREDLRHQGHCDPVVSGFTWSLPTAPNPSDSFMYSEGHGIQRIPHGRIPKRERSPENVESLFLWVLRKPEQEHMTVADSKRP